MTHQDDKLATPVPIGGAARNGERRVDDRADPSVRGDDDGREESADQNGETRLPPCQAGGDERSDSGPSTLPSARDLHTALITRTGWNRSHTQYAKNVHPVQVRCSGGAGSMSAISACHYISQRAAWSGVSIFAWPKPTLVRPHIFRGDTALLLGQQPRAGFEHVAEPHDGDGDGQVVGSEER